MAVSITRGLPRTSLGQVVCGGQCLKGKIRSPPGNKRPPSFTKVFPDTTYKLPPQSSTQTSSTRGVAIGCGSLVMAKVGHCMPKNSCANWATLMTQEITWACWMHNGCVPHEWSSILVSTADLPLPKHGAGNPGTRKPDSHSFKTTSTRVPVSWNSNSSAILVGPDRHPVTPSVSVSGNTSGQRMNKLLTLI